MARSTRSEWAVRVRKWRSSGLTAREFATREGVNARTLAWWSSQLRRERVAPAFVDVTALVTAPTPPSSLELLVRDAVRIRVSTGFDAELLRAVVAALESR